MSIIQRTGTAVARPQAQRTFRVGTAIKLPFTLLARALVGSGSGPREYRREGFPEHEMQQIISGRRDKFQGL